MGTGLLSGKEQLSEVEAGALLRFCQRRIKELLPKSQPEDQNDVVAEAMFRLIETPPNDPGARQSYLNTILTNLAAQYAGFDDGLSVPDQYINALEKDGDEKRQIVKGLHGNTTDAICYLRKVNRIQLEKDSHLVELDVSGKPCEEIAASMGFKNPTNVLLRLDHLRGLGLYWFLWLNDQRRKQLESLIGSGSSYGEIARQMGIKKWQAQHLRDYVLPSLQRRSSAADGATAQASSEAVPSRAPSPSPLKKSDPAKVKRALASFTIDGTKFNQERPWKPA